MLEFYIKHARQSVAHANEAVELLKMSRQVYEARRKGVIDANTANEAICRLNAEAAAEIETSLRLQKMAVTKKTMLTKN